MADILVPVLGESVTEATIAKWTKKSGETVKKDEVLVELETDKVSLEVASPSDGVLQILVGEGETVTPGIVLGTVGGAGASAAAPKAAAAPAPVAVAPAPVAAPAAASGSLMQRGCSAFPDGQAACRLPVWAVGGEKMIRSELLQALAKDNPELRADEVEQVVDIFFDEIAARLAEGGRVELRGFGAFSTRQREARTGRNPRSGDSVSVPAKRVPYFKPGKEIRERLNK